jgi:hypothetical protein
VEFSADFLLAPQLIRVDIKGKRTQRDEFPFKELEGGFLLSDIVSLSAPRPDEDEFKSKVTLDLVVSGSRPE